MVEASEDALKEAPPRTLAVVGDAADDDVLLRAGIERAAGLVAATGDDATNLFVALSAHTLNLDLPIVARANDPATAPKLIRAGATHVISPYTLSGRRIARQLLYPSVTDFLDVVMHSGGLELWLEECHIAAGSDLHDKTAHEAEVRHTDGGQRPGGAPARRGRDPHQSTGRDAVRARRCVDRARHPLTTGGARGPRRPRGLTPTTGSASP